MKFAWSRLLAIGLVLGAFAVLAPPASAVVVHLHNGRFLGVTFRRGANASTLRGAAAVRRTQSLQPTGPGELDYAGGPVLHSSAPHLIFWTPNGGLSGTSELLMARYFADVAADSGASSNVFGIDRQFTDTSGFADYRQTFSGSQVITDTQTYPGSGCGRFGATYNVCLTDAQLQSEISRLIAADGLPTGLGANAPIYFVVTPPNVNICIDSADCADNAFCAYHGVVNGTGALYAATPFFLSSNPSDTAKYAKSCQQDTANPAASPIQEPNGDLADVAISYMSHEDNESITDPLGTAWFDFSTGNEDGDNCTAFGPFDPTNPTGATNPQAFQPTLGATGGGLYDQLINGHPYYTQSEWSNGDGTCAMRPTAGLLSTGFTGPSPGSTPVGMAVQLSPAVAASYSLAGATWDFGDGGGSALNPGGPPLAPVVHTYFAAGRYPVTLTVIDDRGNLSTSTHQVVVGSSPAAGFRTSPGRPLRRATVKFSGGLSSDPDGGVRIVSYAWSFGDGSVGLGATPRHSYRKTGKFRVTLTVTNSLGLANATTRILKVLPAIGRVSIRGGTLLVAVNGPGRVSALGKRIRVRRARTVAFALGGRSGRIRIRFLPRNGAPATKTAFVR